MPSAFTTAQTVPVYIFRSRFWRQNLSQKSTTATKMLGKKKVVLITFIPGANCCTIQD